MRLTFTAALSLVLCACAPKLSVDEPPQPLGAFVLGHNIVVAKNAQKVPISREASSEEWQASLKAAIEQRLGQKRYSGDEIYNLGISVDGYVLAPPGVPVLASPKSALIVSANIWHDESGTKLNTDPVQLTILEDFSGATVLGSGYTRSKAEQMDVLSFKAARRVEAWLLEHPEWFGMTKEEQAQLLAARADAASAPLEPAASQAADLGVTSAPERAVPEPQSAQTPVNAPARARLRPGAL